jgi:hypothetical protein
MACIVVASPRRLAGAQRQHRLAAVERLDQGFFAHSQHDGMLGRRDIETHHVAHLGHEVRVGRELERLHPVRLQAEARQMRCTLETDKPPAFAMPRELQCVAFLGTLSKVVTITASTRHRRSCAARRNAARHAGRPLDAWQNVCAICRPSHSLSRLSLAATSLFCAPSAQANAIRTLSATASAVFRRLANDSSPDRASSRNLRGANCRPAIANSMATANIPWHNNANLLKLQCCELVTRDTSE